MRELLSRRFRISGLFLAGLLCGAVLTGTAFAAQNHMIWARNSLNTAYSQLQAAIPDKGGHRKSAMNLVQQAISQVNAGISAGAH